jgi:integrase
VTVAHAQIHPTMGSYSVVQVTISIQRTISVVRNKGDGGQILEKVPKSAQRRCARALGDGAPPVITIHDLRHTDASLLLSAGEPVKDRERTAGPRQHHPHADRLRARDAR